MTDVIVFVFGLFFFGFCFGWTLSFIINSKRTLNKQIQHLHCDLNIIHAKLISLVTNQHSLKVKDIS